LRSIAVALAVARKDLTAEWRTRELVPALAQFVVLALVIANFGFQFDSRNAPAIAPGVLWMTLVFAGLVAFGRAFAAEREQSSLEAMLLTPASPAAIFAGKALAAGLLLVICEAVLLPALAKILPSYPDITVEVIVDYGLANIVAQRYDAGIRPGELVAKDMIAVRVSPDLRMAVVGAPSYFADRKKPRTPQDLTGHNCLNLRLPTHGGLYAWEFEKDGRALNVRVDGQLVFNGAGPLLQAALNGFGLAYEYKRKGYALGGNLVLGFNHTARIS